MSEQIKAIIIDSDVLVIHDERRLLEAFQQWNPLLSPELHKKILKSARMAAFEKGEISSETFHSVIMSMISPLQKKPSLAQFCAAWKNTFIARAGMENIISRARSPKFLIANTDPNRWAYLRELSIIKTLFQDSGNLILSYLNKCRIPELGLCLKAIEGTKLTKLERKHILYVGASAESIEIFSLLGTSSLLYNPKEGPDIFIRALRSRGVW